MITIIDNVCKFQEIYEENNTSGIKVFRRKFGLKLHGYLEDHEIEKKKTESLSNPSMTKLLMLQPWFKSVQDSFLAFYDGGRPQVALNPAIFSGLRMHLSRTNKPPFS
jgi:hypothetical protein